MRTNQQPTTEGSPYNLDIANGAFGNIGISESLFEALAARGLFTTDEWGNITAVDGFTVVRWGLYWALSRSLTTSEGSLQLKDYLTPEEIAACLNEEKHRRAERLRILRISRQIA